MKIEKAREKYKGQQKKLQCPLCDKPGFLNQHGSFVCKKGHCFDMSAKGYLNFIPHQKQQGNYSKSLFESREKIYRDGFYQAAAVELAGIIKEYMPSAGIEHQPAILDAGCGEGYYASELNQLLNEEPSLAFPQGCSVFGIDIVKEAIILAARKESDVKWLVADLTHIPMQSGSMDVILNILTPANYEEFLRVLTGGGLFIKVIPGSEYLREIRAAISEQLQSGEYSDKPVSDYFSRHISFLEKRTIKHTFPISGDQLESFLHMTPMTFGADLSGITSDKIQEITIHLEILVGKKEVLKATDALPAKTTKNRKRKKSHLLYF